MFMRFHDRTTEKARSEPERARSFSSALLEVEAKACADLAWRSGITLLAAGVTQQRQPAEEVVLVGQVQPVDGERPLGRRNVPGDSSIEHAVRRLTPILVIHD